MRAVSYAAYGELPVLRDLPDPTCPDGGILVRVAATGVCRSDWHAWLGHDPVPLPMVPGHEFAGVVAAVGAGVTRWRVGDRVTVPFACGCGVCEVCRAGDTHVCPDQTQPGFTGWGSFADLVAVSAADANVVALPDEVGFVEAGLASGGEEGPVHSAALLVHHTAPFPLVSLRVDWDDHDPVATLRKLWVAYKPQMGAYLQRAIDPTQAPRYGVPGDP